VRAAVAAAAALAPGDTFSIWSDARTRQTRRVHVATTFQEAQYQAESQKLPNELAR